MEKKLLFLSAMMLAATTLFAQEKREVKDGGMKQYYVVYLTRVPDRPVLDSAKAMEIQSAHIGHLDKMAAEGKLSIAGPFMDDQDVRGICIYNTETMEEAVRLAESDPAVKAGRLKVVCRPWYSMKGACLK